jgi:hypothetical protein
VSYDRGRWAVLNFNSDGSAGEDDILPILQEEGLEFTSRMIKMYYV